MKAIRVHEFGGPEVLRLEEIETPEPSAGQVRLRVHAAGVNPVDTYIRSGTYAVKPALPYTPGFDAAGVVEKSGRGVTTWRPGDRVYTVGTLSGAYAAYTLCREDQLFRLPDQTSFAEGAALGIPYTTAYRALFQKGGAKPGETVLVHGGTGGVGLAAIQLSKAAGLRVAATGGTESGRALAAAQGADLVLDHGGSYADELAGFTGGRGVDLILEMLADVNLGKDLTLICRGGRVVIIGSRGTVEINPRDAMTREAVVMGMVTYNATPREIAAAQAAIFQGLVGGELRPVIRVELPLEEASRSHELVMQKGAAGKIVLTI